MTMLKFGRKKKEVNKVKLLILLVLIVCSRMNYMYRVVPVLN